MMGLRELISSRKLVAEVLVPLGRVMTAPGKPQPSDEWKRRLLDEADFHEACRHAQRLLDELEQPVNPDLTAAKALWLAFVASYARPFKASYNSAGTGNDKYMAALDAAVPAEHRALHKRLLETRDKEMAHSDATVRDIAMSDFGPPLGHLPSIRNPYIPPPKPEREAALRLATFIRQEAVRLRRELKEWPDEQ